MFELDKAAAAARKAYFGEVEFSRLAPEAQQRWREVAKAAIDAAPPKTALDSFIEDVEAADIRDAERYRLLRRGQHWSVIDGIGDTLRAEALDAAVDSAMKGEQP